MERSEDILKDIEEWVADEEKIKGLNKAEVVSMLDNWLCDFKLV